MYVLCVTASSHLVHSLCVFFPSLPLALLSELWMSFHSTPKPRERKVSTDADAVRSRILAHPSATEQEIELSNIDLNN